MTELSISGAAAAVVWPTMVIGIVFSAFFVVKIWSYLPGVVREARRAGIERERAKLKTRREDGTPPAPSP